MLKGSSLTVLNLSQNSLGNQGLKKLLENLSTLDTIQEINVSDNGVDMDGVVLLSTYLCTLKDLTEIETSHNGNKKLVLTFSCSRSDALHQLTPDGRDILHKKLRLTQCDISPSDMNKLCKNLIKCPDRLDLDFSRGTLTDESIEKLVRFLPLMSSLSLLNLSSNFLKDEDVKTFVQLMPKLQISSSVSLNDNRLTEVGALYLLNLMNTCERVAAVEVRLSSCTVQSQHLYFLLNSLATLKSVQTLELRNNSFNAEAIKHLVTELCRDSNHRTIRIMEPWIKGEVAVGLVACCLQLNPYIKEIRVEKTWLNLSTESRTSATVPNENGNRFLSTVHSISFDDCEVEGQHLSSLQSTVQKCPSLQELHFSQLTMGADGAAFLSSVLPLLENLKILSLNSKGETEDEAVIFALRHTQKHLERLSLSHHVIKDSGAAVLGNALQGLTRMRSLSLSQCLDCTATGGRDLVRGLVQCHFLEEIRLDSLELDEESIACFAQGLQTMTSLKKISITSKMTSKDGGEVLCLLASLHTLIELEEIEC
ncbi:hypothetical protein PDJAM_G00221540 [Pangasius djambal]|uniref:Uncharacterized protein n=1 Tax=Pangasius djambal TaxID=1691987 RepID=A0ACC5YC46_9TELE|nr:hypothetical protein [Pangasius djambal]